MNLPKLSIQTGRAEIGIQHHKPPMSIKQEQARMSLKQELSGSLQISKTASQLYIDQTEAFADAGLKGPLRQGLERTGQARQSIFQYIAKTVRQGEQMKKIETGQNVLPHLARENGERQLPSVNYGTIPENAFKVQFHYVPSSIAVDVSWPDPTIRFDPVEPKIQIPRWEANAYLQQKNWITYSVQDESVNKQL
ncbi:DUF6470 family protein [Evansella tamaricis]|uniref:Uncharacterized protein n=1 Tax=Evansella tamaricis TaxID=2069301 RepID=A0ABS6JDK9_9BACI|nr:DUF6470 family protein [Evansella tamaricis]MBU9711763.1 hypothetical protein [Evansella tamaricis]